MVTMRPKVTFKETILYKDEDLTWMNLEGIMLNEINKTEKVKYCMISLKCGIKQNKTKPQHQTQRKRDQICDYQTTKGGGGGRC